MKLIQSKKNYGKLISFKRFLYRKDKTNSSTINWRCTVKSSDGDTPSEQVNNALTSLISGRGNLPLIDFFERLFIQSEPKCLRNVLIIA